MHSRLLLEDITFYEKEYLLEANNTSVNRKSQTRFYCDIS